MFTLEVVIKNNEIPENEREELFAKHATWIQKNYEKGTFLLMGPYTTKEMTGIIIGQIENLDYLEKIIKEDAFYPNYADSAGSGNILNFQN